MSIQRAMFVFLLFLYYFFLSDPTLNVVLTLLNDLCARWHMIGIALEVNSGTLESLEQSPKSDSLKLADVIKAWINTQQPPVTWETLINVIEGPLIKNKKKANEIRDYLGIPH